MIAAAYAQAGKPAEGLKLLEGLIADMDEDRVLIELSPLLLLKGDLLVAMSQENIGEAVGIYKKVLDRADQIGSENMSLQAATRLCKLDMMVGDAAESGQVLSEIFDSFTEGFDTLDLREAKLVLDELHD